MLIVPHELGHAFMGELCGFSVKEIRFCPYGGNTVFEGCINGSLKEEWMVLLAGPMMQMVSFFLLSYFLPPNDLELLRIYHLSLLGFNFLPFYPLDGGKAVQLLLSFFLPYYSSLLITISFSLIGLSIFSFLSFCCHFYQLFFIFLLVLAKCLAVFRKRRFLLQSYLLVRYLHPRLFKRQKVISNPYQIYMGCRHIICINGMEWTEKSFLNTYFQSKKM